MRELDRNPQPTHAAPRLAVVGGGRLGTALTGALREAGVAVDGPLRRGADGRGSEAVVLCVPDSEIATAAAAIPPGPLVGHCSGALGLQPLGAREAFALHPLMTFTGEPPRPAEAGWLDRFSGAGCAIAGSSPRALELARSLAASLRMRPVEVRDADRPVYHAAASVASNFLVTLEAAAERLAREAGVDRELLAPLARASLDNWAALGAERALTGPLVRGDEATVERQRAAIAERGPDLLELFDALTAATRALAAGARQGVPA